MGYYRGAAGDYYSGAARGDLWGSVRDFASKASTYIPAVAAALPTGSGIKNALGTLSTISASSGTPGLSSLGNVGKAALMRLGPRALGALGGPVGAGITAASIAIPAAVSYFGSDGKKKRRSMNAANVSALRRALRRVDSFRNLAKKSGAMPAVKRFPAQRGCASCGKSKCNC